MDKINLKGDHVPWSDTRVHRACARTYEADSFSQNMWDPSSQRNPHP
jgi:hypothetical protein